MPTDPDTQPRPRGGTGWTPTPPPKPASDVGEWGNIDPLVPGTQMSLSSALRYGFSVEAYNTWLNGNKQDPVFQAMFAAYGDPFVQFTWNAQFGDQPMSEGEIAAELLRKGWSPQQALANYRGGGGGGSSKAEQYRNLEAEIRNLARTLGVPMDDAAIVSTARNAVNGKWSSAMIEDYVVGSTFTSWDQLQEGYLTNTLEQIKQLAASQLITMSDDTAKEYAKRAATSEFSLETLQSVLKEQARQRYGWAAPALDAGMTMADYTRPLRDTIANELEMAPATIDLMDSKWMDMLQTEANGQIRAATQGELVKRARSQPEFARTTRAADMSAAAGNYLRQFLGA